VIKREGRSWVAHCPEFDVASQGSTIDRAKRNLVEAVDLFLECAGTAEIARRDRGDVIVTRFEVKARRR
jgi:predicted RNase H-like HicB family nuclease